MPQDGSNNYYYPPGTPGIPDQTIESEAYNAFLDDLVNHDLNFPRPIHRGGTGASSVITALANLTAEKATQLVTDYDSHVWLPGSFYSATSATAPPVAGHAFAGICYLNEAFASPPTNANVVVSARDLSDTEVPSRVYARQKVAGVWSAWSGRLTLSDDPTADLHAVTKRYVDGGTGSLSSGKVSRSGDTMTGPLILPGAPTVALNAATKQYVDDLKQYTDAFNNTVLMVSDTAPVGARDGSLWWESDSGLLYVRYNDGDTTQWVIACPQPDMIPVTPAEYLANSAATKWLSTTASWGAAVPVVLPDAATVTPNFNAGIDFIWTITANRTLANPINIKPGQKGVFYIVQGTTGSHLITSWGSFYKFPSGGKPLLSTAADAIDTMTYACKSATEIHCFFSPGMT